MFYLFNNFNLNVSTIFNFNFLNLNFILNFQFYLNYNYNYKYKWKFQFFFKKNCMSLFPSKFPREKIQSKIGGEYFPSISDGLFSTVENRWEILSSQYRRKSVGMVYHGFLMVISHRIPTELFRRIYRLLVTVRNPSKISDRSIHQKSVLKGYFRRISNHLGRPNFAFFL